MITNRKLGELIKYNSIIDTTVWLYWNPSTMEFFSLRPIVFDDATPADFLDVILVATVGEGHVVTGLIDWPAFKSLFGNSVFDLMRAGACLKAESDNDLIRDSATVLSKTEATHDWLQSIWRFDTVCDDGTVVWRKGTECAKVFPNGEIIVEGEY